MPCDAGAPLARARGVRIPVPAHPAKEILVPRTPQKGSIVEADQRGHVTIPNETQLRQPKSVERRRQKIWDATPQQTPACIEKVKKPWIVFEVPAAGTIGPRDLIKGADSLSVGMCDLQPAE